MWPNPQCPADLITFIEVILHGKLHFLCSDWLYWLHFPLYVSIFILLKASYNHKLKYQKHDQKKGKAFDLTPVIVKMLTQKLANFNFHNNHFPSHRKLHQLFNRNNVKISYSYLLNIKPIINAHNRKILYPSPPIGSRTCKCINMPQCLLHQKSLSNNILYQANFTPISENS